MFWIVRMKIRQKLSSCANIFYVSSNHLSTFQFESAQRFGTELEAQNRAHGCISTWGSVAVIEVVSEDMLTVESVMSA